MTSNQRRMQKFCQIFFCTSTQTFLPKFKCIICLFYKVLKTINLNDFFFSFLESHNFFLQKALRRSSRELSFQITKNHFKDKIVFPIFPQKNNFKQYVDCYVIWKTFSAANFANLMRKYREFTQTLRLKIS